jgi:hypothetical protein
VEELRENGKEEVEKSTLYRLKVRVYACLEIYVC